MSCTSTPPRLIYPTPRYSRWGSEMLLLPSYTTLGVSVELNADLAALFENLWRSFTRETGKLKISAQPEIVGHTFILTDDTRRVPAIPELPAGASYALTVDAAGVAAVAADATGMRHAWMTLLQLLQPRCLEEGAEQFSVPHVTIHDAPAMAFRGLHLCVFPETSLLLIEKVLKLAGLMKYSHVVLEFWGTLQLDALPELAWPGAMTQADAKRYIDLARQFGLEVVPMFNAWGHAAQSRCRFGRHAVLDQNPRLAPLFEPDGWTWCLSNPATRRLLKEVIHELAEFAGPGAYFHLGCDEAYSHATCDRCRSQPSSQLYANHINDLAEEVAGLGRRSIIWGDALLDAAAWKPPITATSHHHQQTHLALDELSRQIVIADWQYDLTEGEAPTVAYFVQAGFDVLACPWYKRENIRTLADAVRAQHAMGMLVTTWDALREMMVDLCYAAGAAWVASPAALDQTPYSMLRTAASHYTRLLQPAYGQYAQAGWSRYEIPPWQGPADPDGLLPCASYQCDIGKSS